MKTKVSENNRKLYLSLLDSYFNGNGIPWGECNMQRKDVLEMVAFYGRVLKQDIYIEVVQYLISDLLYIE